MQRREEDRAARPVQVPRQAGGPRPDRQELAMSPRALFLAIAATLAVFVSTSVGVAPASATALASADHAVSCAAI